MNTTTELIQHVIDNYECQGQVTDDNSAIAWKWDDLFGGNGRDGLIWSMEVYSSIAFRLFSMIEDKDYENGLMLAVEIVGPSEPELPYESPWWHWQGASDARAQHQETVGNRWIGQTANAICDELFRWFHEWPPQSELILHFANQVEKKPALIMGDE